MGPHPDELEEYLKTPHTCQLCGEQIFTTDELVLIEAVYPNRTEKGVECYQIDNGMGHYEYEPMFLHLECWEDLLEDLNELTENTPPLPDPLGIFDCSQCKSAIRAWETSCLITPGELRHSPQKPNGEPSLYFHPCCGIPMLLCVSCTARLNEEVFDMWEQFSHNTECDKGLHKRCWRIGSCAHGECMCPEE